MPNKTFYVYIYRDPERNNVPIYVGKGCDRRFKMHLNQSTSSNQRLANRVKTLRDRGLAPYIEVVQALDEGHAFFLEECLIELFGRRDLNTGSLYNRTNGGEGVSGRI